MSSNASDNQTLTNANQSANQSTQTEGTSSASIAIGAGLITAGFLANTLQGALGKQAQTEIAPGQFLWLLLITALIVLLPIALWQKPEEIRAGWNQQTLPFYLVRAVFGLAGFYLFVWAAGLGSLIDATVLLNTTPIFIPLIGVIALNQQIPTRLWGAIALGFIGLLLVVQPSRDLLQNPANLLGLGAGLAAAIEFLTVRQLSQKEQTPLAQTTYYLAIGSILIAPLALWQWSPITIELLQITSAAAGLFLTFQLLLVQSYRFAEPYQIGAFQYSSVIFAAIIGWLFFNELPNIVALLGMVLICLGGGFSIYANDAE